MTRLLSSTSTTHAHSHAHSHAHATPTSRPFRPQEEVMARESDDCLRKEEEDEEEQEGEKVREERSSHIVERKHVEGLSLSVEEEEEEEEDDNGVEDEEDEEEGDEMEETATERVESKCIEEVNGLNAERKEEEVVKENEEEEEGDDDTVDEELEEEEGDDESVDEELEEGGEDDIEAELYEEVYMRTPEENHQREWIIDERQKMGNFEGKLLESDSGRSEGSDGVCVREGEDVDQNTNEAEITENIDDELHKEKPYDDTGSERLPINPCDENIPNNASNSKECETLKNTDVIPNREQVSEETPTCPLDEDSMPDTARDDDEALNCTVHDVKTSDDRNDQDHVLESLKCFDNAARDGEGACDMIEEEESVHEGTSVNGNVSSTWEASDCGRDGARGEEGMSDGSKGVEITDLGGKESTCDYDNVPTARGFPIDGKDNNCMHVSGRECVAIIDGLIMDACDPKSDSSIKEMKESYFPDDIMEKEELQESVRHYDVPPPAMANKCVLENSESNLDNLENVADSEGIPEGTRDYEGGSEGTSDGEFDIENDMNVHYALENDWNIEDILESATSFEDVFESVRCFDNVPKSVKNVGNVPESAMSFGDVSEIIRDFDDISKIVEYFDDVPDCVNNARNVPENTTNVGDVYKCFDDPYYPESIGHMEDVPESDRDSDDAPESMRDNKHISKYFSHDENVHQRTTDSKDINENSRHTDDALKCTTECETALEGAKNTENVPECVMIVTTIEQVPESTMDNEYVLKSDNDSEDALESDRDGDIFESASDGEHVLENDRDDEDVLESDRAGEDVLENARDSEDVLESDRVGEDVLGNDGDDEDAPENDSAGKNILESDGDVEDVLESDRDVEDVLENEEDVEDVLESDGNAEDVLENEEDVEDVLESDGNAEDILENARDGDDVLESDGDGEYVIEKARVGEDVRENARINEAVLEDANHNDFESAKNLEDGLESSRNNEIPENTKDSENVARNAMIPEDIPDSAVCNDGTSEIVMGSVDPQDYNSYDSRGSEAAIMGKNVHVARRIILDPHTYLDGTSVSNNNMRRKHQPQDARRAVPVPISERGATAANEPHDVLLKEDHQAVMRGNKPIRGRTGRRRGIAGMGLGEAGERWVPWRVQERQEADPLACLIRQRPAPLSGPKCTCGTASSPWRIRPSDSSLGNVAMEQHRGAITQRPPADFTFSLALAAATAEETELTCVEHKSLSDFQGVTKRDGCRGSNSFMASGVRSSPGWAVHAHSVSRPTSARGFFVPSGGPLGVTPPQTLALAPCGDGSRISASCHALCGPQPAGRKGVRSCILPEGSFFPNPAPFVPLPGSLRSRVQSEPDVSGRLINTTPARTTAPRGLSQLFSGRRKSIASCIFPTTSEEDTAPYTKTNTPAITRCPAPTWGTTAGPQAREGHSLPAGGWDSPKKGCCGASPLGPAQRFAATDPRPRQARPGRRRPQSLVIIPETQVAWVPEPVTAPPGAMSKLGWGSQSITAPSEPLPPEERRRLFRGSGRSWSFSPADVLRPVRVLTSSRDPAPNGPRRTASLRGLFTSSSLRSTDVIFPWRRGEPTRTSGRTSPGPLDAHSQSQGAAPCPSQSPTCLRPEEATNGEVRNKDGAWWRGRPGSGGGGGGGTIRTTRKDKTSSSPAFRRASLSHSEWDIRSRPWSHVYGERDAAKLSQSVCRLAVTSCEERGIDTAMREPSGGLDEMGPSSLPLIPSSSSSSSTHIASSEGNGVFQKFKKSLSLRLARKGSREGAPPDPPEPPHHLHHDPQPPHQPLPRRWGSFSRDDDPTKTTFLFGHPLFRSSKERRRARLRDARATKCNSADSGDSGIELVTGSGHVTTPPAIDPDLFGTSIVDSALTASLADEGSGSGSGAGLREPNPRAVRRTHSDVGGRGATCYSRQMSTPQPIKVRPAHRLPQHNTASLHRAKSSLKRSKGSSHLRRSISQPLDLDKTTSYDTPTSSLRRCRSPDDPPTSRHQRRPSAGDILNEDNTTSEDETGMSDSEDFRGDLKRSLDEDENLIVYAEALWDHVTLDAEELVFKAGDLITVIDSGDKDWWWGRISSRAGWFPAAFVRILVNQEDHQGNRNHQDPRNLGPARKLSISGLSHDQIRTNVINEIISTERDFVKHLRDVIKGYLMQIRKRGDMFSKERIAIIFGNMEALYHFQSSFLKELEECIDWKEPYKSCIGATFIRNREKFEIYSEYCNNHPAATSALQELYTDQKYVHFFEACRLLQEMIDISLDGFLLTPVQKICKYPLQLQELLKYTKTDHPDHKSVKGALDAMRDVALLVNERKRRMECLEKIASWQMTVEGWEGQDLLEESSQLMHQGEVTKGAGGAWPKDVTLFLFDHQLVYCKRDLLKRNTFVYRGRLNLDMCEVMDSPPSKDSSLNLSNGWRIHSIAKNKWYTFSCKTPSEKLKWMEAFRKERALVAADESAGFVVGAKAKNLARVAARNQRNRPKRPRTTKSHKRVQAMTYAQAELLVNLEADSRSNSLPSGVQGPEGKKKGLWFSFGGHKKGRGSGRTLGQIQHHPV